jgi:hypothetical protein
VSKVIFDFELSRSRQVTALRSDRLLTRAAPPQSRDREEAVLGWYSDRFGCTM